ncbi:MAG: rhodanese-like protein [Candidatus Saccharibacteria bacterium]|nr:rhodanese-like protein [Candidatus Saccharibacteria bacterium]
MEKIILFYKFVPVKDTETLMHWQNNLCASLGLKGRILISEHGINGTLGGEVKALKAYVKAMKMHSLFKDTAFKWSVGGAADFPRLSVKVRPEIVTFGVPEEIEVDENGIVGGGKRLKPEQVHRLVQQRGGDVVFMDGRNAHEAAIGKFKNAVIPDTKTTKDFIKQLEKPEMQALKDKPIVSYCTGGIRCEILTALMKKRGFNEVYQLDGGIAKYGEKFKDDGLWEGKLYVFDRRMNVAFSQKAKDIGDCCRCKGKTSNYENCTYNPCSKLILICKECAGTVPTCGAKCNSRLEAAALDSQ